MNEVILERYKLNLIRIISEELMEDFAIPPQIDFSLLNDFYGKTITMRIKQEILGENLQLIKYPANWKEAIKERFFPVWLKKKYPIKYTVYEARCFYPKISLPDKYHKINFYKMENLDFNVQSIPEGFA